MKFARFYSPFIRLKVNRNFWVPFWALVSSNATAMCGCVGIYFLQPLMWVRGFQMHFKECNGSWWFTTIDRELGINMITVQRQCAESASSFRCKITARVTKITVIPIIADSICTKSHNATFRRRYKTDRPSALLAICTWVSAKMHISDLSTFLLCLALAVNFPGNADCVTFWATAIGGNAVNHIHNLAISGAHYGRDS